MAQESFTVDPGTSQGLGMTTTATMQRQIQLQSESWAPVSAVPHLQIQPTPDSAVL